MEEMFKERKNSKGAFIDFGLNDLGLNMMEVFKWIIVTFVKIKEIEASLDHNFLKENDLEERLLDFITNEIVLPNEPLEPKENKTLKDYANSGLEVAQEYCSLI